MESELIALFEAAKTAADAATSDDDVGSETRCLDALNNLKIFPVNYQILVSTQVGKRLRHLTKHPKPKIQNFAADLIEIWKNIIIRETAQKKNDNPSSNNSNNHVKGEPLDAGNPKKQIPVKTEKRLTTETIKVEKVEHVKGEPLNAGNPKKQISVKTEKPLTSETIKVDKIEKVVSPRPHKLAKTEAGSVVTKPAAISVPKLPDMVKTQDGVRNKVREMLLEALSKVISEADDNMKAEIEACDPIRVAVKVESVMFEKWGRSTGAHKFKYRSIMFNIKDANNPDFRRKVLLGEIKAERICNLTTDEMASEQRRLQNKEIEEKKLFDCERGAAPKATTDQFKCGRCGQRKCTYYQLQTRSADEPMTTFVTCVNCNNHWKFC
ncbi:transcription elongation factor TFIIS [Silene latifolia]|uniref:transcription elongation factor TFIIS n=1 Tax=Silene latifolia TaxID=37657 RepID=UPI003D773AA9